METYPTMQSPCTFLAHVYDCSLAARFEDILAKTPFLDPKCPSLCDYLFAVIHSKVMTRDNLVESR